MTTHIEMIGTIKWLMVVISFLSISRAQAATDTVLCYYESWAKNLKTRAKFEPADIPAEKCTHIVYTYIRSLGSGDIQDFRDDATLRLLIERKTINPNLKVLVSIGGWAGGSPNFTKIINNLSLRDAFVEACSAFVDKYSLDGIDFVWYRSPMDDNRNFVVFLSELRNRIGSEKIITVSVGWELKSNHDVTCLNYYVNFIILRTYGYVTYRDGQTGHPTPLYGESDTSNSANATIQSWIEAGASPFKLLFGLSFGGQSFELSDAGHNFHIGSLASGPGMEGPFIGKAGYKLYLEICYDLKQGNWSTVYVDKQECIYSFKDDQWVGYDNARSIKAKTQYAIENGMGGVAIWAISQDDRLDVCGGGTMPLLGAITNVLGQQRKVELLYET